VQYDLNGNIRNLKRQGPTDVPNVFEVDDLEYTYADNDESNRLERVEDLITYTPQTGSVVQDFQNGNSGSTDYIYDPNGNIISDANKNVSNIQYTFFGKPQRIEFGDGAYLDFIYTASGRKIEERKDLLLGNTTTRDFMGALVYENGILNLIHHPEGHSRLSSNPSGDAFVYDYFVKDHLGNVRTTVTAEEYSMQDYLATHEIAFASIEHLVFDNIEEVRAERPGSTPSNEDAAELDASNAQSRIGTSLLLRVMPGDKFGLSAQAYVDGEGTGRTGTVSAADMLTSIANTLINGSGNGENPENGHSATLVNSLFNQSNYSMTYQTILNQNTNNTHPRSYINYIVFDINMRVVPSQSGAIQVNGVDNVWHVLETFNDIEIEQAGYLAVYISNESMEKMVFFDNINIKYYKGKLLEENHYYPFGMALTIAKDANYDQKELYQTKELFRDKNLNIYDFEARQYDAILGRFMSNDPMNQYASGYVGMGNNPVSNVDPTGMLAWGADQTKISLIAGLHTQDVMWNMMLANDRASLSKSAAELRFNADLFLSDIQGVGDEYIRQAESRIDQWRANNAQKQHHNDVKTSALNAAKSKNVTLPEGLSTADYEGFLEAAFSEKGAIIVGADGVVEDWGEVVGQYFSLDDRITKAEFNNGYNTIPIFSYDDFIK
jgi:RHS repeat-associated protein